MENINDSFFDGHYKDIWRSIIPGELTQKEVDFIVSYFRLTEESKVLDIMCGYGRHAIALAQKGITVTAVDNLEIYTAEISQIAAQEGLKIKTVTANAATFSDSDKYDLAICMGNSLQFFKPATVQQILTAISKQLTSNGKFLINSWSIAEIVWSSFKQKGWSQIGDLKFLTDSQYYSQPARIETQSTIITPQGSIEEKTGVDYIYSINELEMMLNLAGMQLNEVYSIPGRKKFGPGEPRAYLIAEKATH